MVKYELIHAITKDIQISVDESFLQNLLPASYKLEVNEKTRILSLLSTNAPHILAQQQFTMNEWNVFITLLVSYPHYVPHEVLLASITSLSPSDCRKRLQEVEQLGPKALKRELKPVHRALSGIRAKLDNLCPLLKISLIRDLGYALTTASE
jgi:hypothetical protein